MTRLTGFLSGLLLVIALAVAAVRYAPAEFFAGDVTDEPVDPADENARAAAIEDEPVPDADPTTAPLPSLPRVDDAPPAAADTGADAAESAAPDTPDALSSADETDAEAEVADAGPAEPDPAPRQWHAFWQPFHSEISAEGFRRRLEGVTGLDYRVVSPRPGEYQVAFAYRDEAERLAHLAAIEAATGLVLRSRML